ncbi:methyltransferase [Amycolatopsis sp. DG1A-15b]|uniref:methyltransferase n=1 Tax=Amycolatopsis sp. DG1A-15b TaxID=3052846 RepID=UPI00255BF551|nr:methyltransferase [Amycolatopsis sp. DG1A-15b]WIX92234.1 methyltransferase [Amycolatopsis sp. DG1A-15b]
MFPERLERAVYGLYVTHAVQLACAHGVFDALLPAPAPSTVVAEKLGLDRETLHRILVVLGGAGLLESGVDGWVVPADLRPFVDSGAEEYLGGFVTHLTGSTAGRMSELAGFLERGKPAGTRPFDALYHDEAATERFLQAMWDLSHGVSAELAALSELDTATHLVDVGGASGPFAVAALRAAPSLTATVFDLPAVGPAVARTRERFGLAGRLGFTPGDFFRDRLPEGDRIAFGYILSDWADGTCAELLAAARRACRPGGLVLIMERLFDDDGVGPLATAAMNLSMHVETEGRHRSAAEYVELLTAAGFHGCEVRRGTRDKHLVLGRA